MLHTSDQSPVPLQPVTLAYEADLLGNIQQALAGLQGFGIMALELIQNADDAGATSLLFDVTNEALFVRNSATFSTCGLTSPKCPWENNGDANGIRRCCNFHAISRMGSRSKVHVTSQIGRFGIGFVSVYQITDRPIVRSAGIEMILDPLRGTGATRAIPETSDTEFELPWASMSTQTRRALNASPTPPEVTSLVVAAIAEMLTKGLFFLRHLQGVELRQNGVPVRSVSIERQGDVVTLHVEPGAQAERWKLLSRDSSDLALQRKIFDDFPTLSELGRSPVVNVAVPLDNVSVSGLLYAYLPTEQLSGLPLHINADFFPHPTRRMITLTGEGHERYWNELLLDTAAKAIAEDFDELRELLGSQRLWALASASHVLRDTTSFKSFWIELQIAAKVSVSVLTVDSKWCLPTDCYLPDLPADAQKGLASIGVNLLHEDLRPHWTVLSVLGANILRLPTVIAALEDQQASRGFSADNPHLHDIWQAVDSVLLQSKTRPDLKTLLNSLKAVPFVLDVDGTPTSIASLWRPEAGIFQSLIRRFIPDCPIVHDDVLPLAAIAEIVNVYELDDFARDLSSNISDEESAKAVIGVDPVRVREFYSLLTGFDVDIASSNAGSLLANVPMLHTASGFVSPSRGQLPGGFVDPIGHFELIDTTLMAEKMQRFTSEVLAVNILTFSDYVNDHLTDILKENPTREQYIALLQEILEHKSELDADGGLEYLAQIPFVRIRDRSFARPSQCYYWTAALEALLGSDGKYFVDEDWMPSGRAAMRFRDLLEYRLGMRSDLSITHIVDRIEAIATSDPIDKIASETQPIVRHILSRFSRLKPDELESLEKLRTLAWLPAAQNGERVQGYRYPPKDLYRSFRAPAFASQVKIVDLPILRTAQTGRVLAEFLDFLELPEEPPTEAIVAHLEHCIAQNLPASDLVYAILSERSEKPDADRIDRLADKPFIYDADLKRYLKSDQVFWTPTSFRGYWHTASTRMLQREPLYRRLGVHDVPSALNYAALLQEIAASAEIAQAEIDINERCLAWLADAIVRGDADALAAVVGIRDKPCLLNIKGSVIWPDEAAWLDSEVLAAPFVGALDERLVAPPLVSRPSAARLFKELKVDRLSDIAQLRLATEPESVPDVAATALLRERSDLLLWLSPNEAFGKRLHDILRTVVVRVTDTLQVQAEIAGFDPPVRSAPTLAPAFYDTHLSILFVTGDLGKSTDWTAAFGALFASFEQLSYGTDMPPVVMTAAFVASLSTAADAERALRSANYRPPEFARPDQPLTERIADALREDDSETPEAEDTALVEIPEDIVETPHPENAPEHDDGLQPRDEPPLEMPPVQDTTDGVTNADHNATTRPVGPTDQAPFKSKPDDGGFGQGANHTPANGSGGNGTSAQGGNQAGGSYSWQTAGNQRSSQSRSSWHERRSRLRSYVNATPPGDVPEQPNANRDADLSNLIDMAAISAVIKYEQHFGRFPTEQPHNNPGFDIISAAADGSGRRLIEVKGLEGNWTERGVKLSTVQFATAQRYHNEYWIYVVEHARDPQNHRVSAIANPFAKVNEYWFDHGWKEVTEEVATAMETNLQLGAKIKHAKWGVGTIGEINRRGIAISLLVDFLDNGRKLVPFNADLEFLD
ncbi:DUF3883 domain-containing protein [Rhizobium leguminosarum]|uniref:DUF3883 domain-containing protein n=1 Tax=Rhizobium leguminosarum TaxID=384 RepID=UPI003F945804